MKLPLYILDKPNLILLHEQDFINQSKVKAKIQKNQTLLTFSKTLDEEINLVVGDELKDKSIKLHFLDNVHQTIVIMIHLSKKNSITLDFVLEKNSQVDVLYLITNTRNNKAFLKRTFTLYDSSKLYVKTGLLYNGTFNLTDSIYLKENESLLDYEMLNLGSGKDHFTVKQQVIHQHERTSSKITNLLVSSDEATLDYDVSGTINKGMKNSVCKQQNRGLILGEFGSIKVEPKLNIDEYDVQASHGAAIGQINEDEMFYLLSRGLSENEAKKLIISGYTSPFLSLLKEGIHKQTVSKRISKKIKGVVT
ncbi:MAG: SufD family Fe-S cluster assembly protein [Firmicutes bacterium]|nr:SufD family Fe-S cluster assembly protein [Bacillota bacterium]